MAQRPPASDLVSCNGTRRTTGCIDKVPNLRYLTLQKTPIESSCGDRGSWWLAFPPSDAHYYSLLCATALPLPLLAGLRLEIFKLYRLADPTSTYSS